MQSSTADNQLAHEKRQQLQQQLASEAAKRNLTLQQYISHLKEQAARQQQPTPDPKELHARNESQHKQHNEQRIPVNAGPPKEKAIAIAKFLQSQDLKIRTCILQEKRKDMFKGRFPS